MSTDKYVFEKSLANNCITTNNNNYNSINTLNNNFLKNKNNSLKISYIDETFNPNKFYSSKFNLYKYMLCRCLYKKKPETHIQKILFELEIKKFQSVFDCLNYIMIHKEFENIKKVLLSEQQQLLLAMSRRVNNGINRCARDIINKFCTIFCAQNIFKHKDN